MQWVHLRRATSTPVAVHIPKSTPLTAGGPAEVNVASALPARPVRVRRRHPEVILLARVKPVISALTSAAPYTAVQGSTGPYDRRPSSCRIQKTRGHFTAPVRRVRVQVGMQHRAGFRDRVRRARGDGRESDVSAEDADQTGDETVRPHTPGPRRHRPRSPTERPRLPSTSRSTTRLRIELLQFGPPSLVTPTYTSPVFGSTPTLCEPNRRGSFTNVPECNRTPTPATGGRFPPHVHIPCRVNRDRAHFIAQMRILDLAWTY